MPYIKDHDRKVIDEEIQRVLVRLRRLGNEGMAGRLNYAITSLVLGTMPAEFQYEHINRALGVLECAKQEFYRRLASPYEDSKAKANGDLLGFRKAVAND